MPAPIPGDPNGSEQSGPASDEELEAEVERLRIEKEQLAAKLDDRDERRARGGRTRRAAVGIFVVLGVLCFTLTIPGSWARRTLLDTGGYVDTIAPLSKDPAITAAFSRNITEQAFSALDVETVVEQALPEKAAFLAAPLTNGVKGFVQERVNQLLGSDEFQRLWISANAFAQSQLIAVLNDDSDVVSKLGGQVSLNLIPLINQALDQVQSQASQLLGKNVTLPQISAGELPAAAREKIESALGISLPDDFGQVVLFETDRLEAAQDALATFNKLVFVLGGLALVLSVLALLLSRRRRRTLLQLAVADLVGVIMVRRIGRIAQSDIVDRVADPVDRAAVDALTGRLLDRLLSFTVWIGWVLVIVIVVAAITGPYPWAAWIRARVAALFRVGGEAVSGRVSDDATLEWIRAHLGILQVAGAAVAIVLLLALPVGWLGFLVIAGLLALYEVGLWRLGGRGERLA